MSIHLNTSNTIPFLCLGLLCGTFSAMFGVGSGVIIIPTLTYFTAISQKDAQGISLAVMVPMALMGAIRYHLNPEIHINYQLVAVLVIGILVGVNVGANIVAVATNRMLQCGFGCFLILVGIRFIYMALKGSTVSAS